MIIEVTPTIIVPTITPVQTVQVLGETSTLDSKYLGLVQVKEGTIANIYQNPSIDSLIINTVPSKSFLFYTEKGINWYKVDLVDSNQSGWVRYEDIDAINNE